MIDTAAAHENWEDVLGARLEARSFVAWADTAAPGNAPEDYDPATFGMPSVATRWRYVIHLADLYDDADLQRREVIRREHDIVWQPLFEARRGHEVPPELLRRPVGPLPEYPRLFDTTDTSLLLLDSLFLDVRSVRIGNPSPAPDEEE